MTKFMALQLHKGDEVIDNDTKESIYVICSFEDVIEGKSYVMIEGIGKNQGYNHWSSDNIS